MGNWRAEALDWYWACEYPGNEWLGYGSERDDDHCRWLRHMATGIVGAAEVYLKHLPQRKPPEYCA